METSFDQVFCRHYSLLLRHCRRRLSSSLDDPEDFVQRAYLRCRNRWSAARQSEHLEAAYFYRALRWLIQDALRQEQRRRRLIAQRVHAERHDSIRGEPGHDLEARDALNLLSGRQRLVCRLLLDGKSRRQIQQQLKLSVGALAVCVSRARQRLTIELGLPASARTVPD